MEQQIFANKPQDPKGTWDVAIIGSGPAGLTAAIYTTRGAASTIIFGGDAWGGQLMLTTEVDNFPTQPGVLGPDLMQKMKDHSLLFGAEFVSKKVESITTDKTPFEITAGGETYTAKSIIIATGAETRWLGVPGEDKLRGRGVSSCAPCDAPFFKDKNVAVVGGGDSAMEEALVLTKYAKKVTIIHRRDTFKASQAMQKRVFDKEKEGKISIIWNSEVVEIIGDQKVESIKLKDTQTGEAKDFSVDGVFVSIGHTPSSMVFKGMIELDEKGYVVAHDKTATSVPGIFVAGDVEDFRYKQAVTAAGFGCMAAMDTLKYLDEKE